MKIAIILATHIDCNVRIDLLQSMLFSATVAQLRALDIYPDVETRIIVRLSCTDESHADIDNAIKTNNLPKLVIHQHESQFQKIRSEVESLAMRNWGPDYYIFLDDDDMVSPYMIEQYIKYLRQIDNPTKIVVDSDAMHNLNNFDTTTLLWKDIDQNSYAQHITRTNFSGICCSTDMLHEFIDIFHSEIDSGLGVVDIAFTRRIRRKAVRHIYIPISLMYYRQWQNPRSWHDNAPETQHVDDLSAVLGGVNFSTDIDVRTDNGIDFDGDGIADLYVGAETPAEIKLHDNIDRWRAGIDLDL